MSRSVGRQKRDSRLPRWTWAAIFTAGVLAYVGVGTLLLGPGFRAGIEDLWRSPGAFASSGAETVAPFVLLLIPAILGVIWTRDTFRVVLRGLHRGDPPMTIAKEVALFALSFVVLMLVGLFTSSRPRD